MRWQLACTTGWLHTFRTTSSFEQMVRIGTPINKPTPAVYSHQLCFLLFLSLFLSARSRLSVFPFLWPFIPSRFLLARFRSLFHHVQGKPINHRIPRVYCGTPLLPRTSNKSRALIFRESSFRQADVRTFANYWPVVTHTLPSCENSE